MRFWRYPRQDPFSAGATLDAYRPATMLSMGQRNYSGGVPIPRTADDGAIVAMQQSSLFARVAAFFRIRKGSPLSPRPSPSDHVLLSPVAVIGLVPSDEDRQLLTGICSRNRWSLIFADTREEARTALDKMRAPVVFCDRDLPGNGWRRTVEDLASSPHGACIILLSRVVDTYLWNEVVRIGGFDVLSKPLREDKVVRMVRLAWSYWNSAKNREIGRSVDREIE